MEGKAHRPIFVQGRGAGTRVSPVRKNAASLEADSRVARQQGFAFPLPEERQAAAEIRRLRGTALNPFAGDSSKRTLSAVLPMASR
jgi:hypothetical protein